MSDMQLLIVQGVLFVAVVLPLVALPWLLVIWVLRKLFGKKKDREVNNG